jgi:hypothetical protein
VEGREEGRKEKGERRKEKGERRKERGSGFACVWEKRVS